MSVPHWSYVAMLAFCLVGTLPLVAVYRLRALRHLGRLAATVVLAGGPFLVWDVLATRAGQWRFDADQTLRWRVLGLPLEEVAFFVVIPLAGIITYEAVQSVRAARTVRPARAGRRVR